MCAKLVSFRGYINEFIFFWVTLNVIYEQDIRENVLETIKLRQLRQKAG